MSVSWYGVACALSTAAAIGLVMRPPPQLRMADHLATPRLPRLLHRSTPPATSLGVRLATATAAGTATALVLVPRWGWPSWLAAALVGVVAAEVLARLPSRADRRREQELILQTPQALDLLAAALTAGLPLRLATRSVVRCCPGPVSDAWAGVLDQIDLGVGEVEAWRGLRRHPQLGAVAADLARSVESGTMLGATLAVHAEEARALRTATVEIAAREVGVRSVMPLMLCFIPAFLLLGIVPTLVSAVLAALAP